MRDLSKVKIGDSSENEDEELSINDVTQTTAQELILRNFFCEYASFFYMFTAIGIVVTIYVINLQQQKLGNK